MLFFINMVEIKLFGLWKKMESICEFMFWLLWFILKCNLLDEIKVIFMLEKKVEKVIVIRICIIIFIIVSELVYWISFGVICNSFCIVCWCCIFYSENICVIINLIFCYLLVGFKFIIGNDFVFLFNVDKFVRIDFFLFFILKE